MIENKTVNVYLNIDFTVESQVASKSFEQYEFNYSVKYVFNLNYQKKNVRLAKLYDG